MVDVLQSQCATEEILQRPAHVIQEKNLGRCVKLKLRVTMDLVSRLQG